LQSYQGIIETESLEDIEILSKLNIGLAVLCEADAGDFHRMNKYLGI